MSTDWSGVEPDLARWLHLLTESKGFVLVDEGASSDATLKRLDVVPKEAGMVWVSGCLHLANGDKLDAVFQVHSVGAELHAVYVSVAGAWHLLEAETVPEVLGSDRGEVFPYDYELAVPFEADHYH